ncbi:TRAP transporter small permease [bacterium]|nr:TRAP transporter small permease [bacterium]
MKALFFIDKLLLKIEASLLNIILITMLAFASTQVILRNFFDTGIEWGDVFARHLVLVLCFFGATISTKEDKHIRIDALLKVISKRWLPLVEFFVSVFCIIVSFLLTLAARKFMMDERMADTVLFGKVKTWYFLTVMPIGFSIITFRFFIKTVESLFALTGKKADLKKLENSELDISVNINIK